ncbi:MAG: P-II family nitrogen regulator [Methanobacteriaceae archaeon]|nr:P-II family nitrogen regulator [Methanobacteriaceae archaeon]
MIPKKILVLKNEGSLEIDSHDWLDMEILNYNQISIDGTKTCLLKEPSNDNFYSINEKISQIDGLMIFAEKSYYPCIINLEKTLIDEQIPYVILSENELKTLNSKNCFILIEGQHFQAIIKALNRISSLIKEVNGEIEEINEENNILNKESDKKEFTSNLNSKVESFPHFEKRKFEIRNFNKQIEMQHEESLKKVRFTLHPIMLDSVKSSMKKLGFSNITITDIKHYDSEKHAHEIYRASNYEMKAKKWHEIMIVVRKNEVDFIVNMLKKLKNDDIGNEVIISSSEDAIRISSEERGSEALD